MHTKRDLTQGSIPRGLLGFALPLILGNLLQQLYNLADTWVVGQFIGEGALAAVGSSYTLMTFLTSILLGLCMGSSVYFSIQFGRRDPARLRNGIFQAFLLIGGTPWTTWGALPCGPGSGWGTSPSRRCAPTGRSWRRP